MKEALIINRDKDSISDKIYRKNYSGVLLIKEESYLRAKS